MNSRQRKRKVALRRLNLSRRRSASRNGSPQIYTCPCGRCKGLLGNHHPRLSVSTKFFSRVYALVRKIPRGRVVTYGQIARTLGMPRGARTVGWAMRVCDDDVPWHRVVNARGRISVRPTNGYHEQRARLKEERVKFDREGKIDLNKYAWKKM
jgi:methylated-DNA-protein-cysteine methyltransferase-like protein